MIIYLLCSNTDRRSLYSGIREYMWVYCRCWSCKLKEDIGLHVHPILDLIGVVITVVEHGHVPDLGFYILEDANWIFPRNSGLGARGLRKTIFSWYWYHLQATLRNSVFPGLFGTSHSTNTRYSEAKKYDMSHTQSTSTKTLRLHISIFRDTPDVTL